MPPRSGSLTAGGDALEKSWYMCGCEGLLEAEASVSKEEPSFMVYCFFTECSTAARTGDRSDGMVRIRSMRIRICRYATVLSRIATEEHLCISAEVLFHLTYGDASKALFGD